jgi:hypothetical protein
MLAVDVATLDRLRARIMQASECGKHGRDDLRVCTHCEITVWCAACPLKVAVPCGCWMDLILTLTRPRRRQPGARTRKR